MNDDAGLRISRSYVQTVQLKVLNELQELAIVINCDSFGLRLGRNLGQFNVLSKTMVRSSARSVRGGHGDEEETVRSACKALSLGRTPKRGAS